MQHEFLELPAGERVDPLNVGRRAQSGYHQRLGFTPGEERRPVGAGQQADLAGNGTHVLEAAPVDALALHHKVPELELFEVPEGPLELLLAPGKLLPARGHDLGAYLVDAGVPLLLVGDAHRFLELLLGQLPNTGRQRLVLYLRGRHPLGLAKLVLELLLQVDQRLDRLVSLEQRVQHIRLGHHGRAAFHHHDAVPGPREVDVDITPGYFGLERIHHPLAVDPTDPNACQRTAEGDIGYLQRQRSAEHGHDVRIVLTVRGEHGDDDLGLGLEAAREQRTNGPVNQAAREDFLFRGTSLALEEASGDPSRGKCLFLVVDGQREEVDVFPNVLRGDGGCENNRLAVTDQHGAVGLLGHLAQVDAQRTAAIVQFDLCLHMFTLEGSGG